jgi:hypothetical protein
VVAVVGAGTAVALAAVRDIHGAAMLAGILIAAALRVQATSPRRAWRERPDG